MDPCEKIINTNIRLVSVEDSVGLELRAAHHLTQKLTQHADQPVILLVSGGSSLRVVNRIDPSAIGKNVELCIIDERFGVAKEDENYFQLSLTDFAQEFVERGGTVCHGNFEGAENLEKAGEMFAAHVKRKALDSKAHVIALLGIGEDGHTAGILPSRAIKEFGERFENPDVLAVGYDAGIEYSLPLRVTVTLSFLRNHVEHAVLFADGCHDCKAVAKVIASKGALYTTPARIVREMPDVHIFAPLCNQCNQT